MSQSLAVAGHSWKRTFFYGERPSSGEDIYHQFTLRSGAAQIGAMLDKDSQRYMLPDECKTEYMELNIYPPAKDEVKDRFLVSRHIGYSDFDPMTITCEDADAAVVWDEGWDDIEVPESGLVLWASNKRLPSSDQMKALSGRCFLLVDADLLRSSGAMISRGISWERTATDLLWQFRSNHDLSHLLLSGHILIPCAEEAAVYIRNEAGSLKACIILASGNAEGTARDQAVGLLPDTWPMIVYQTALQFACVLEGEAKLSADIIMRAALSLLRVGYLPELMRQGITFNDSLIAQMKVRTFSVPDTDPTEGSDPNYWCITDGFHDQTPAALAFNTVFYGFNYLRGLPRLQLGSLVTIDRSEIEAYQNIKNLILHYASSKSTKPLSIAVFGAPGSGKTFGVTRIATHLLPGVVQDIAFNVSQFTSDQDLTYAFHRIRDVALMGKLPLVFFDEFDSDKDGRDLGWLKSFLMPMQDGVFKDGTQVHPIGNCIFVFAGATAVSFENFTLPMRSDHWKQKKAFQDVKGPDFVSRLRGTINVLGPNPRDAQDQNYILRRALLLCTMLERRFGLDDADAYGAFIDENVLRAMLLVPEYRHGARSMQAILDMSRIGERKRWNAADLPSFDQLNLHVNAEAFMRLVLRDVSLSSYTMPLARVLHEKACQDDSPLAQAPPSPWENLTPAQQHQLIGQAAQMGECLRSIGCYYDAGETRYPTVDSFTTYEILELGKAHHAAWKGRLEDDGWKHGPDFSVEQKTSPYLLEWDELPEGGKQLFKDAGRDTIALMSRVGLRVYRRSDYKG
ncbi:MAG: hypothetical protein ACOX88_04275 [Christensenellales bacterium]|jgi:hypothetical protein